MRFSSIGYYVEKYVKCANCGILLYGDGTPGDGTARPACSARTGVSSGPG